MLWLGHIVASRLIFGQMTIEDALWSIAPDIPMALFLSPLSTPWSVMQEWDIYKVLYNFPHSILALTFVPHEYRKLYTFHIICDILTHTGRWSIQPIFPFNLTLHGVWDPVEWS
jgi:hypothetical protein